MKKKSAQQHSIAWLVYELCESLELNQFKLMPIKVDKSKYNSNAKNSMESWTSKIAETKNYMALLRDGDIHELSYFCENFISSHLLYAYCIYV